MIQRLNAHGHGDGVPDAIRQRRAPSTRRLYAQVNELESLLPTHWDEQQLERKWDACVANPDGGLERFAFTAMELKYLARERLAEVHARTRRGSHRWRQT